MSFQWMQERYSIWFADWLHVNFIVRTVILLLMVWLIIFVVGLLFKYVLGPLVVLFYVNIIKRAWNFFVTETAQEWIYINYSSKGDPKYAGTYHKLCDKVKKNHVALADSGYMNIHKRGHVRKVGNHLMVYAAIIAALWIGAFGINQEYVTPVWGAAGLASQAQDTQDSHENEENDEYQDNQDQNSQEMYPADADDSVSDPELTAQTLSPDLIVPGQLPADGEVLLALTDEFREGGARLRDGPGTNTTVVEMLWGYGILVYLGYYMPDDDVDMLYWLRVRTPSGMEGYIGSQLVEVVG